MVAEVKTEWSTLAGTELWAVIATLANAGNAHVLFVYYNSSSTTVRISDETTTQSKTGLTDASTARVTRGCYWQSGGNMGITGEGLSVVSGSFDGTLPTNGVFYIGCKGNSSMFWFGNIRNLRVWDAAVTDRVLQDLTSPVEALDSVAITDIIAAERVAAGASAAVTGTATASINETDIQTDGTKTIIITTTGDTWIPE
jgi:hypothetical protein